VRHEIKFTNHPELVEFVNLMLQETDDDDDGGGGCLRRILF